MNIAGIGIGSRGGADLEEISKLGHNIIALCDVDDHYAAKEFVKYPNARRFKDYRVLLERMGKEIDGVVIGTPDHTHAVITLAAISHGKHVYCEKPLAHTIGEVRAVMAAAAKHKVVTQLGNQGHSTDSIRRVCEWIQAGAIGKVHTIHAGTNAYSNVYSQLRNLPKLHEHHDIPPGLDYDLWLGPVTFVPYSPLWVPWNWRGWMHFGGGAIGDWICHVVDPAFWALGLDAPFAVRAFAPGFDPATQGATYPAGTRIEFEFPAKGSRSAVKLVWFDGNISMPRPAEFGPDDKVPGTGAIILGEKGMIVHGSHGGDAPMLVPDALMDAWSGSKAPPQTIPRVKGHAWDWIDAIRNDRRAGSDFSYGGPLSELGLLGLIALRFPGEYLHWDARKARFTNHREANAWVKPVFRHGWKL